MTAIGRLVAVATTPIWPTPPQPAAVGRKVRCSCPWESPSSGARAEGESQQIGGRRGAVPDAELTQDPA